MYGYWSRNKYVNDERTKKENAMKKIFTPVLTALIMVVVLIAVGIGKLRRKKDTESES